MTAHKDPSPDLFYHLRLSMLFKGEDLFGFLPLKRLMYVHTTYRWGFPLQIFFIWIRNINRNDSRITLNGAPYRFSCFNGFSSQVSLTIGVWSCFQVELKQRLTSLSRMENLTSIKSVPEGPYFCEMRDPNLPGWKDEKELWEGSWSVFSSLGTNSVSLPRSVELCVICDSPACFMLYCHRIKQFRGVNTLLSLPPNFPSILEVHSLWFSPNEQKAGWWFVQMKTTLNKFLLILSLLENDFCLLGIQYHEAGLANNLDIFWWNL